MSHWREPGCLRRCPYVRWSPKQNSAMGLEGAWGRAVDGTNDIERVKGLEGPMGLQRANVPEGARDPKGARGLNGARGREEASILH